MSDVLAPQDCGIDPFDDMSFAVIAKRKVTIVLLGTFRAFNEDPLTTVVDEQVVVRLVAEQRVRTGVLFVAT